LFGIHFIAGRPYSFLHKKRTELQGYLIAVLYLVNDFLTASYFIMEHGTVETWHTVSIEQ
jgi:hypothetical protein